MGMAETTMEPKMRAEAMENFMMIVENDGRKN